MVESMYRVTDGDLAKAFKLHPPGEVDPLIIAGLIAKLRIAVEALEGIADLDDDGWTSDGHERCTECADRALTQIKETRNG